MKIATNVQRESLGGISKSNINFLDSICDKSLGLVGIELNSRQYMKGPTIFRHLPHWWFDHHIINIHDVNLYDLIRSSKNLRDLENKFRPVIKIIKKILHKTKPDVVLLNGTYFVPWLISIAAFELKIPIVLRYAGIYTKETETYEPKAKRFFNQMEKSFQKRVSHFIFPSRLCKDTVEREIIKKEIPRSYIIPNPFHAPPIKSTSLTVERRICAIGRWHQIKNFDEFFRIHKRLLDEGWRHEASFVTGDAKIKNLPKTINRFSSMNYEELLKFYGSQGLVICPSHFETFGNVPIEAACMGIPVLVSSNMGCAEVLRTAGLENMIVSFSDKKLVLKRIKELCGQQILPKQINNLRKALDPRIINAEIFSVLREAAGQNNS